MPPNNICLRHGTECPCPKTCPCQIGNDCDDGGKRVEKKFSRRD